MAARYCISLSLSQALVLKMGLWGNSQLLSWVGTLQFKRKDGRVQMTSREGLKLKRAMNHDLRVNKAISCITRMQSELNKRHGSLFTADAGRTCKTVKYYYKYISVMHQVRTSEIN